MDRRVFVTGLGMISPAGAGVAPLWDDLCAARSRFSELTPLYAGMKAGTLGARVTPAVYATALSRVSESIHGRPRIASVFAEYAALEALADAGFAPGDPAVRRAMVCVGTSDGQADVLEDLVAGRRTIAETGRFCAYSIADDVADAIGSTGPAFVVHSTCASANVAVSCAVDMLRAGVIDIAVVGGCDPYSEKNIIGFSSLQAIGPTPCRPFAKSRRYVTPSEGAGMLVLQAGCMPPSNRPPYAEVLAAAVVNDASHPTAPDQDGVAACHDLALNQSGLTSNDIDAIFAHGTGSRANDRIEGEVFAKGYPNAAVTAIKSTIGHLMGAAGAAGAVASCLALRHRLIPPTAIAASDLEPDINLVTAAPLPVPNVRYVQNNSFGFGGNNAITIFGRVE